MVSSIQKSKYKTVERGCGGSHQLILLLPNNLFSVKVCGLPEVSPPENLTLEVGQTASFLCVVDMTCMVSYVEWYRHSDNGLYSLLITDHPN